MNIRQLLAGLTATFLLLLSANSTIFAQAQDDEPQRVQSPVFQSVMGTDQIYFIDQLGLQLLTGKLPEYDYINNENFRIGPQDALSIDVNGPVPFTARGLVVNSEGKIYIPIAGNVDVNNLTLDEAHAQISEAIAEKVNEFDLRITIDRPRAVTVSIYGDIPHPGKYTAPAGTRLDALVYAALTEGIIPYADSLRVNPEDVISSAYRYSIRNIQVNRHANRGSENGDLIRYYRNGHVDSNPYLYQGDEVRIERNSGTTPTITISGAVYTDRRVEYNSSDTFDILLRMAGGYLQEADRSQAVVYRTTGGETRKLELDLSDESQMNFDLEPNDRIIVPYVEDEIRSYTAWVLGEAIMPGIYPIDNEKISLEQLLDTAGGLTTDALGESAYITRNPTSNRNVRPSTDFSLAELQRTSDQLTQGFDYLQSEERLDSENRVHVDLTDQQILAETMISDGDRLYIPKDYESVILYGQVNNPGTYSFDESMSVEDYLLKAGGMTIAANTDRIFVIKAGSRAWKHPDKTALQSGDIIFVDRTPYDELQASRNYDIQLRNMKRSNLQLILTTVSTITAVITTVVAIRR
jgi:protein involved in polysaccharide export with SLBB domain